MVRHTSLEVYEKIKESGVLSKLQHKVFRFVVLNAPCTQLDAVESLGSKDSIAPRFSDLVKMGLIRECGITNRS